MLRNDKMDYKQNYVLYYWFELKNGIRKKGEITFEAENKLSPEFRFENINAMIEQVEPAFHDRTVGDYFIR
jgi:hypothetical protein